MGFNLIDWHKEKLHGEVIVDYDGDITQEVISNTLALIEQRLNLINERSLVRKKVYNVFVECIQNLYHHVDTPEHLKPGNEKSTFGVVVLSKEGSFYRISTGNYLKKEKLKILKDRIEQLNSLSDLELKALYREILNNEELSNKGGGGLGMVDIVRKTGNKLDYRFYDCDENHLFFSLDVYIS
jgi:hypothetical protein